MTAYWAAKAWLGRVADRVLVVVDGDRISSVTEGAEAPPGATRLPGILLPGLANAHSHAFHRALRGAVEAEGADFWGWRDAMYRLAGMLRPDTYHRLARAVYAEMALAGITVAGEFHYVHHGGGVGIGRSIHAGVVAVADGSDIAARKLERVLLNDPGTGVMRHADAGYERAREVARERSLAIPMQ